MLNHDIIATPPTILPKTSEARSLPADTLEWAINLAKTNCSKTVFLALLGMLQITFGLAYPWLLPWADQHHLINPAPSVLRPGGIWLVVILASLSGAYLCLQALALGYQSRQQLAALEQIKANRYATAGISSNK